MHRHELTDAQYALLEPYMPKTGPDGGHPWAEHRRILNAILWRLHTRAPWRDLPTRYGPWQTVYDRYHCFCQDGRFACILVALRASLDQQGLLDWQHLMAADQRIGNCGRSKRAAALRAESGPRLQAGSGLRPERILLRGHADPLG